ncbi:cell wall protein [Colletotrichum incanum]|uniref:Cell wall protein n=1 Tax=Colletotrichum incanum TaxID=1573173 RepID=A0A167DY58_COLIC|nr:cell wall protein [Colletotrichum incanum]OHW97710.1 cell wall protein [Colletotrichum incanum]
MQLTKTLLFALVGIAFAAPAEKRQAAVIQQAVTEVQGALTKLDTAVKGVGDDIASAQPVLAAATDAQNVISKAGQDIQAAQPLQLQEALGLQQIAGDLQTSVSGLMDTLISKKPNFDKLGVSSVVLQNLQQQKSSTQSLGQSLISKVPAIGQGIAQQAVDQISAVLDKGIQAYSAGGAAPAPGGGAAAAQPVAKPGNGTAVPPAAAPAKPKTPAAAPAAPKTPAAAPAAPAGGLESLLGGLLGGAGGAGGANGAAGLGGLLTSLTGGAAGGNAGGAGGLGALFGGLGGLGGAGGGAATKTNVVDFAQSAAEEDEE